MKTIMMNIHMLFKMGYLKGIKECKCGSTSFTIQNDAYNKTSGCIFRYTNYKCKLKYSIRINSLFDNLPNIKLSIIINTFRNH